MWACSDSTLTLRPCSDFTFTLRRCSDFTLTSRSCMLWSADCTLKLRSCSDFTDTPRLWNQMWVGEPVDHRFFSLRWAVHRIVKAVFSLGRDVKLSNWKRIILVRNMLHRLPVHGAHYSHSWSAGVVNSFRNICIIWPSGLAYFPYWRE